MPIDRREFLINSGLLGLAASAAPVLGKSKKSLKILVLGGTGFIGPHMVRHALERGHEITLFNRGKTGKDMFPQATQLVGDRDGGLQALAKGEWDAVIDNSGYVPRHVRDSAQLLKGRVGRYLFISTMSVFDFMSGDFPLGVGSKLQVLSEPGSEDVGKHYGALKVLCEQAVEEAYGESATIVRPTYVCGPGDRTQRYTWWVDRIHRGGDVLAPGDPLNNIGIVDAGDLARFVVHLLEQDTKGIYNATGPAGNLSFSGLLESIRAITDAEVRFHWVENDFLAERISGRELPMWGPGPSYHGLVGEYQSSVAAGLRYTPLAELAQATRDWHQSLPKDQQAFTRAGLDPDKEAKILADWKAAKSA